jgi:hypothetical protein
MSNIKEYYKSNRVSNSLLSALKNPRWLKIKIENPDVEDEEKKAFRIGSAVDCLLTDPSRWDDEFVVSDCVRPNGLMSKFVDELPCELTSNKDYQVAYEKSGYKIKIEKVIDKFNEDETAKSYHQSICNMDKTKYVLSKDEYELVMKAKDLVLANPFTQKYFINLSNTIELLHQYAVYFEYKGFQCKALLDGIRIDHNSKTIEPFDLKTTSSGVYNFENSFREYGYYRQAAMYLEAIKKDEYIKSLIDKDYKILDFKFIVVDSKLSSNMASIIYQVSSNDMKVGLDGGYYSGKHYPGINNLIEDLRFHLETEYWDLPRSVYINNGIINLDAFRNQQE